MLTLIPITLTLTLTLKTFVRIVLLVLVQVKSSQVKSTVLSDYTEKLHCGLLKHTQSVGFLSFFLSKCAEEKVLRVHFTVCPVVQKCSKTFIVAVF